MISAAGIKSRIMTVLESSGVFDSVTAPPDDRKGAGIMREPAAAVFFSGIRQTADNGVRLLTADYSIYMKFLKIGVNETCDDIETAMQALSRLEPVSLSQKMLSTENQRSAVYLAEVSFTGCAQ